MTQEATRKTIDAFQVLMIAGGRAALQRVGSYYRTKDFVMFVAVNNDVHNIHVLVNKETVVKLKNSFELNEYGKASQNRKAWSRTLHTSVIGHVTGSSRVTDFMFVDIA